MYLLLFSIIDTFDKKMEGGLFDFDATLPLMTFQFLLLMILLNILFYKPIAKVLDDRDEYIRNSLTTASAYLIKADELTQTYEQDLASSRKEAQEIIRSSQQEAQKIVSTNIKKAQQEAEQLAIDTSIQLNIKKEEVIKTLEKQVDALSEQIKKKLLSECLRL